ncbi:MAG: hypothetical protein JSR60_19910 [Proteobacteria bacterium]|nr:hypothetical protein [Pseudomonadota bacterium]
MTREILERLLLFFVPFVLYGSYLLLLRLQPPEGGRRHPWTALVIAGLVLYAGSFVVWGIEDGEPVGTGAYVAPHMENGRIVPAHFDTKKK